MYVARADHAANLQGLPTPIQPLGGSGRESISCSSAYLHDPPWQLGYTGADLSTVTKIADTLGRPLLLTLARIS